jgi:hypothetical protein
MNQNWSANLAMAPSTPLLVSDFRNAAPFE